MTFYQSCVCVWMFFAYRTLAMVDKDCNLSMLPLLPPPIRSHNRFAYICVSCYLECYLCFKTKQRFQLSSWGHLDISACKTLKYCNPRPYRQCHGHFLNVNLIFFATSNVFFLFHIVCRTESDTNSTLVLVALYPYLFITVVVKREHWIRGLNS